MADKLAAERACKEPNPIIDGRKANVNLAYLGAKPRQNGLASVLPYAIKSIPGIIPSQYGYPAQYVYPASYLAAAASAASPGVLATMPATSPLSPSPAGTPTYAALDYANAYTAAAASQLATAAGYGGYEAYSPYTTTTAAAGSAYGMGGLPAGYTYAAAMPHHQQLAAAGAHTTPHFAQFQAQQIQERLQ